MRYLRFPQHFPPAGGIKTLQGFDMGHGIVDGFVVGDNLKDSRKHGGNDHMNKHIVDGMGELPGVNELLD